MLGGGTEGGGADGLLHFGQLCIGTSFLCAVRGRLELATLVGPASRVPGREIFLAGAGSVSQAGVEQ
jgi:hypothetical protein